MNFDSMLEQYAELIVKVGLNLQSGQRLVIGAPLEAAPLVRHVVASAYKIGARLVDVVWNDDQLSLIRLKHAPRDSFEEFPAWRAKGQLEHVQAGGAVLNIAGSDPDLLNGQDSELITVMQKTAQKHFKADSEYISRFAVNWCVIPFPVSGWAAKVFPDDASEVQKMKLWEMIQKICRLDQEDPVNAWQQHLDRLLAQREYLTQKQYRSLHFKGPGTDLTIGLPQNHLWQGGRGTNAAGVTFTANLPTEEVLTLPHREQTNGVVTSTKPLSYAGTLIERFSLTFEKGRVVDVKAETGEDVLRKLAETDDGAGRLGEVALVPHSSPISQTGTLFYNSLIDENAAHHIALGRAYRVCLKDGETMSTEAFHAAGGNDSLIHVDFMIGSAEVDVQGVFSDGTTEPILNKGEWAFEVS